MTPGSTSTASKSDSGPIVIVPAYNPPPVLLELVRAVIVKYAVVVVDDGSGPQFQGLFEEVAGLERVTLLRHSVNLGKGAALKTGFNHAFLHCPHCPGVVTADADGQHLVEDIFAVAAALAGSPGSLILGVRTWTGSVPLRSKFGNLTTRLIMQYVTGQSLEDTQTGLRGIPLRLIPQLLRLPTHGYDFELDMLVLCKYEQVAIRQIPIQTVYLDGNRSSHFSPLRDSMRIYFVFLRFSFVSILTAVLDNLLFIALYTAIPKLAIAQAFGRFGAAFFNYSMNRIGTFRSRAPVSRTLPRYAFTVFAFGVISYAAIHTLSEYGGVNVIAAKIGVEAFLFFVSFVVQRDLVFNNKDNA
jgi:glycosyltransferase involved in cell wall biosynthesis